MNVSSCLVNGSENFNEASILAALKKRVLQLNDEELSKLVLQLETNLKPLNVHSIQTNQPKNILAACEAKLMQKKNLSYDVTMMPDTTLNTKFNNFNKDLKESFGSRCKNIEKSMNLLNEKCEVFQRNSDVKDRIILELKEKNLKLKEKNRVLRAELKDGQENCTKMVKLFEKRLRDRVNPFVDRTKEVENGVFVGKDLGFRLNEYFGGKGVVSENPSPKKFLAMGRSRRLLSFGDDERY